MSIGFLLDHPQDSWWEVTSKFECQRAITEVIDLMEVRCLPKFGVMRSTADLAAYLRGDPLGNQWPRHIENWFADLLDGKTVASMPPGPAR